MKNNIDENNYPLFDGVINLKREGGIPTAMQEFFIVLKHFNKDLYNVMYEEGILDIALKKEKQRMFHCFNAGADEVSERRFNEWFNQTYNQNK